MKNKMNKGGMFFTLMAISLLSIVAISYTIIDLSQKRDSVEKRIGSLNDYVFSIEEDLPRKLYIAGFRIIFIYEKRILENGTYLSNVNDLFNETFFEGTIDGIISTDEEQLLSGVLYEDIENDLKESANKLNLNLNLSEPEISVSQDDPWNVNVSLKVNLFIEDKGGLASWNRTANLYTLIPIEYFEDPLYLINTNGIISHKIRRTQFLPFVSGSDVSNLTSHVQGNYYYANNDSPSFLNRLEGNLSSNEQGIESLVYLPDLTNNGISVYDKSIVDYIYFSTSDPLTNEISGMPSWFKLDSEHVTEYNLSSLAI